MEAIRNSAAARGNFFVATDTEVLGEGIFLGFDDIAAARDDEDQDDMGIRVEELAFED